MTCICLAHNILNQIMKLNFEKLKPTIFSTSTTEWYINVDCVSNTFKYLHQAENSMTSRAYMEEVLIQV